jgi:hypothetical protein
MRIRTLMLTAMIAVGTAVAVAPAAAAADTASLEDAVGGCAPLYTPPFQDGMTVVSIGEWVCSNPDDPRDGDPLPVTLQRRRADGVWVRVASGSGEAVYVCSSNGPGTYRTRPRPDTQRTFNCS